MHEEKIIWFWIKLDIWSILQWLVIDYFYLDFKFSLKKRTMFIFSVDSPLRLWETNSPAFENSRSDGTDVGGIQRYCLATCFMRGKRDSFSFHHCKGSFDLRKRNSSLNLCISICGQVIGWLTWEMWGWTFMSKAAQMPLLGSCRWTGCTHSGDFSWHVCTFLFSLFFIWHKTSSSAFWRLQLWPKTNPLNRGSRNVDEAFTVLSSTHLNRFLMISCSFTLRLESCELVDARHFCMPREIGITLETDVNFSMLISLVAWWNGSRQDTIAFAVWCSSKVKI